MPNSEYIAERKLRGVTKDGAEIEITVGIGLPYEDITMDAWACPVKMEGLYKELSDTYGIDSWQALRLSQKTVVSLLHGFVDKGGKLYAFDEKEEVTKEEIDEFF